MLSLAGPSSWRTWSAGKWALYRSPRPRLVLRTLASSPKPVRHRRTGAPFGSVAGLVGPAKYIPHRWLPVYIFIGYLVRLLIGGSLPPTHPSLAPNCSPGCSQGGAEGGFGGGWASPPPPPKHSFPSCPSALVLCSYLYLLYRWATGKAFYIRPPPPHGSTQESRLRFFSVVGSPGMPIGTGSPPLLGGNVSLVSAGKGALYRSPRPRLASLSSLSVPAIAGTSSVIRTFDIKFSSYYPTTLYLFFPLMFSFFFLTSFLYVYYLYRRLKNNRSFYNESNI